MKQHNLIIRFFSATLLLMLTFITTSFGQSAADENEIIDIVKTQDVLPRSVFLDSTMLPGMKLYEGNTRQGWATVDKSVGHIDQLYDIRLKFIDHQSALAFHRKFLTINSEGGPEIKDHHLNYDGADELIVFGTPAQAVKMLESEHLRIFCIVMVVDKYFVKLFINCNDKYEVAKFQPMVTEIIRRIKK